MFSGKGNLIRVASLLQLCIVKLTSVVAINTFHLRSIFRTFAFAYLCDDLYALFGVGLFTGIVQAWIKKPQVSDMERLMTDVTSLKGWYKNKIAHVLLIFFLSSLGGAIGNFIAVPALITGLL